MPADNSCINLPGPWTHRLVNASGAQFHVARSGPEPSGGHLILLVHGFPQYWYAWRHQLEALGKAGFSVAAMDIRGAGGSDRTRETYDAPTLAADITGVVRALGATSVTLVGHGVGGDLCWGATTREPQLVTGLITLSAPHPLDTHRAGFHVTFKQWRHTFNAFLPSRTERTLKQRSALKALFQELSAPGATGPLEALDQYVAALNLPNAAASQIRQMRWNWRSSRPFLRRSRRARLSTSVSVPVMTVRGGLDPLLPDRAWAHTRTWVEGPLQHVVLPSSGHFLAEEAPEDITRLITEFVSQDQRSHSGTDR